MGAHVHKLSEIDASQRKGTCAACGLVELHWGGKNWRCAIATRNRGAGRKYSRKKPHGLTGQEAIEYKTDKVCATCGRDERLVVDHDHVTGKIRGVLCHWCNVALGMVQDDPDRLRALAAYLED